MPIVRRTDCVPLPMVICPVVAVVMLESRVAKCVQCVENVACLRQATFSTHCTHLATLHVCSVWRMLPASGRQHSPHTAHILPHYVT